MKMKKLLMLFFCGSILFSSKSYGQDTIIKTIIIDTIILDNGLKEDDLQLFGFIGRPVDGYVSFENDFWNINYFPSLNSKVKFVSGGDMTISFLIDNAGDEIELHHLERIKDTLHITSYKIYKDCLFDSVTEFIEYYHHINDSVVAVPYKRKYWKSLPDNDCKDTLKTLTLNINGLNYVIPIKHSMKEHIQNYDGLPKKRDRKRKEAYSSSIGSKKKIRFNTFYGGYHTYQYSYSGRLDLR